MDEGRTSTAPPPEPSSSVIRGPSSGPDPNAQRLTPKAYDRWYHELLRILIKAAARLGFAIMGRWRVEGAENVPQEGGVILAPNHVSAADWPAVGAACPRPLRWMAKSELFEQPV